MGHLAIEARPCIAQECLPQMGFPTPPATLESMYREPALAQGRRIDSGRGSEGDEGVRPFMTLMAGKTKNRLG